MEMDAKAVIGKARQVFDIEIEGLAAVRDQLGDGFVKLVSACMDTLDRNGKIVVTGVGKSGHVGRKIAATLSSTGSPSIFMHPVEAMHGDLGVLMPKGSEELLAYVNQFLAEEAASGRISELAEKYIYRYIRTEEELEPAA